MRVVKWSWTAPLILTLLSSLSFSATADRIAGVIDSSRGVPLQKSLHPKAQSKYDEGPVEPSFQLHSMMLLMAPSASQQEALNTLGAELQDPKSPNYHKWLTPSQYAARFGLSLNDLSKITTWLKSQGFTIQAVGGGHNRLVFSGTAGAVRSAFKAEIHRYNVDGEEHFANSTPIQLPAALQGVVVGLLGVNNFRMHPATRFRMGSSLRPRPDYYQSGLVFPNFLAPGDVATIYNIPSNLNGSNQKIGIIGETDVFLNDINDFRAAFNLPQVTAGNCTISTHTSPGVITACNDTHFKYILYLPSGATDPLVPDSVQSGDIGEADLDLEWSGAVAPSSQIVFINAPDPDGNGVNDSLAYAIDQPSGSIPAYVLSMSYGLCELEAENLESLLEQGVTEGITIVNSSGDSGAAGCDGNPPSTTPAFPYSTGAQNGLAVNYPASSSYVIAAGGTGISLANDSYPNPSSYWGTSNSTTGGSATGYIPELAWNDNEIFADYCANPYPGDPFCTEGGSPAVNGWVAITSAKTAQEDIWINAGGGGGSNCFSESGNVCTGGLQQPSWQSGLSVEGAPTGVRWVPDVAFLSSPNFPGYIFCTPQNPDAVPPTYTSSCTSGITDAIETYGSVVGGTSASSPLFAGIVALLNQSLATPSGTGLGDIHKTLYTLAGTPSNGAFNPVKTGDNMVYCDAGTPTTQPVAMRCPSSGANAGIMGYEASNADPTTGYNLVTGLGSVNVAKLAAAWAGSGAEFSLSGSTTPTTVAAGSTTTATVTLAANSGSNFTGTVNLSCSGMPTGITCGTFTPQTVTFTNGTASGPATVTISLAANVGAGPTTVTVTGTSGSTSATTTVSFTVTASSDTFSLTSNLASGTLAVKQGQGGAVNLTVNSTNGFVTTTNGNSQTILPVTYTCTGYPTLSTCTIPTSPTQSTAVAVNITTTASSTGQARPLNGGSGIFYASLLPGLFGIVFVAGSRKRLHGMRMLGLIVVLGVSTMWLASCSGSNNSSTGTQGTPVGNYTITINATTGGSGPITSTYQFTLSVTQ